MFADREKERERERDGIERSGARKGSPERRERDGYLERSGLRKGSPERRERDDGLFDVRRVSPQRRGSLRKGSPERRERDGMVGLRRGSPERIERDDMRKNSSEHREMEKDGQFERRDRRRGRSEERCLEIPVNDLRVHELKRSEEDIERCKLASVCRLLDRYNLTFGIFNHVTVRAPDNKSQFLINAFGLNYDEVTASNLIKVDVNGNIKDRGSSPYGINKAGFILHSTIHTVRPDIQCVLHVHTNSGAAVSANKLGLLPISQEAMLQIDNLSYHTYEGILTEENFKVSIAKSLGPKNKLMVLHNHGIVSCGETIEAAWNQLFDLVYACKTQIRALSAVGGDERLLILPNQNAINKVNEEARRGLSGLQMGTHGHVRWNAGELEFEAEMRRLDRRGLRTGYPYKVKPQFLEEC